MLIFPPAPTGWHEMPNSDRLPEEIPKSVESTAACTTGPKRLGMSPAQTKEIGGVDMS